MSIGVSFITMSDLNDKITGCLLGAAIGDALGMPYDGMSAGEISAQGGCAGFAPERGARTFAIPVNGIGEPEGGEPLTAGQWTCNIQLMLALAETIVEEGGLFVPESWAHKLVRWVCGELRGADLSDLQTALQLRTGALEWDEAADPEGVSASPACRVAPAALGLPSQREAAATIQAEVTHGHPDAAAAALAVSEAIDQLLAAGADRRWAGPQLLAHVAAKVSAARPDYGPFTSSLDLARELLSDDLTPETAVRVLGVTTLAREAVPTAFYCFARYAGEPEDALTRVCNLTGGATSLICSIFGALLGALYGQAKLPAELVRVVEEADRIRLLASALAKLRAGQNA